MVDATSLWEPLLAESEVHPLHVLIRSDVQDCCLGVGNSPTLSHYIGLPVKYTELMPSDPQPFLSYSEDIIAQESQVQLQISGVIERPFSESLVSNCQFV